VRHPSETSIGVARRGAFIIPESSLAANAESNTVASADRKTIAATRFYGKRKTGKTPSVAESTLCEKLGWER